MQIYHHLGIQGRLSCCVLFHSNMTSLTHLLQEQISLKRSCTNCF